MSDLTLKTLITVGGSLLLVAAVLMAVTTSLLFKVTNVLRGAKQPDPETILAISTKKKACLDETTTESCPFVEPCDEFNMYADPMPPCFCEIDEDF